jgi:ribonuclease VapC
MIVDSSALVAIILREEDESVFAHAMLQETSLKMSAANWLEAAMIIDSRKLPTGRIRFADVVADFRIEIVPVTPEIAERARRAHNEFGRGNHPARLNYGDCFAYATSAVLGESLLFKGRDFSQTDIEPALKD